MHVITVVMSMVCVLMSIPTANHLFVRKTVKEEREVKEVLEVKEALEPKEGMKKKKAMEVRREGAVKVARNNEVLADTRP